MEALSAVFDLECTLPGEDGHDDSEDEEREERSRLAYKHALRRLARAFPDIEKDGWPQQRPCPCCGSGVLPRWPWTVSRGFCECVLAEGEWDSWREEWEAAAKA